MYKYRLLYSFYQFLLFVNKKLDNYLSNRVNTVYLHDVISLWIVYNRRIFITKTGNFFWFTIKKMNNNDYFCLLLGKICLVDKSMISWFSTNRGSSISLDID